MENFILTADFSAQICVTANSLEEAIELADQNTTLFSLAKTNDDDDLLAFKDGNKQIAIYGFQNVSGFTEI